MQIQPKKQIILLGKIRGEIGSIEYRKIRPDPHKHKPVNKKKQTNLLLLQTPWAQEHQPQRNGERLASLPEKERW